MSGEAKKKTTYTKISSQDEEGEKGSFIDLWFLMPVQDIITIFTTLKILLKC